MKRRSNLEEKVVPPRKKQFPWEDTLILAFRDMQWTRKIQSAKNIDIESLAEPPALLAKLDGNAESASGDVLTGCRGRFFLLEFKSSKSLLISEKCKSIYKVLVLHGLSEFHAGLSMRGHFAVYPEIKDGRSQAHKSMLPVHAVDLMCIPYLSWAEGVYNHQLKDERLDGVYYDSERGLDLVEMGRYLSLLVSLIKIDSDGDGTPFKAVVASSDGMFWPVGDLSDFISFVSAVSQHSPRFSFESGLQALSEMKKKDSDLKRKWSSEPSNGR